MVNNNNVCCVLWSQDSWLHLHSNTVESGRMKCPFDPLQPFASVLTGETESDLPSLKHKPDVKSILLFTRDRLSPKKNLVRLFCLSTFFFFKLNRPLCLWSTVEKCHTLSRVPAVNFPKCPFFFLCSVFMCRIEA